MSELAKQLEVEANVARDNGDASMAALLYKAAAELDRRAPAASAVPEGCVVVVVPWNEWCIRALVRLAIRNLADVNNDCGDNWPAGQEWHQLGHTSQHAFMRLAREEAGIPDGPYREAVADACMRDDALDQIWKQLEEENKVRLAAAPVEGGGK